jgi:hypothetical protein
MFRGFPQDRRVYPKVSGLAAWSENCKWYSSLPLAAVLWVGIVSFATITLCVASQRVFIVVDFVIDSVRKLLDVPSYIGEFWDSKLWNMSRRLLSYPYLLAIHNYLLILSHSTPYYCVLKKSSLNNLRTDQSLLFWEFLSSRGVFKIHWT